MWDPICRVVDLHMPGWQVADQKWMPMRAILASVIVDEQSPALCLGHGLDGSVSPPPRIPKPSQLRWHKTSWFDPCFEYGHDRVYTAQVVRDIVRKVVGHAMLCEVAFPLMLRRINACTCVGMHNFCLN